MKTVKATASKIGGAILAAPPVLGPAKPAGENRIIACLREARLKAAPAPTILKRSRK